MQRETPTAEWTAEDYVLAERCRQDRLGVNATANGTAKKRRKRGTCQKREGSTSKSKIPHFEPYQPSLVEKWVRDTFHLDAAASVPKNELYLMYRDWCHAVNFRFMTPNIFGKFMLNKFPVTSSRPGQAGHQVTHYKGIGVKTSEISSSSPSLSSSSSSLGIFTSKPQLPVPSPPSSPYYAGRTSTPTPPPLVYRPQSPSQVTSSTTTTTTITAFASMPTLPPLSSLELSEEAKFSKPILVHVPVHLPPLRQPRTEDYRETFPHYYPQQQQQLQQQYLQQQRQQQQQHAACMWVTETPDNFVQEERRVEVKRVWEEEEYEQEMREGDEGSRPSSPYVNNPHLHMKMGSCGPRDAEHIYHKGLEANNWETAQSLISMAQGKAHMSRLLNDAPMPDRWPHNQTIMRT